MEGLTWLHLSDWHQKGPDFDRQVVRDALIGDIRNRMQIDPSLAQVHFVVFSGDAAFSGKPDEYEASRKYLFDPVLQAVGLKTDGLFLVPGNHDLSRDTIHEMLPPALQKPLDSDASVQTWLTDAKKRARLLEPFEAYTQFVTASNGQSQPAYASILRLEVCGKRIALLGINSAWMCARNKDAQGEVNDYGYTLVGEPQIHDALAQIADADLRIAVLHHPFDWLAPFDRNHIEARLCRECHFILRGHEHNPQVHVMRGMSGDCVIIPAGASYERRIAESPRYTNAYNFVHLDLGVGQGVVYLRRWSDQRNEWIEDVDSHPGGKFLLSPLPKDLGKGTPETLLPLVEHPKPTPRPRFERERTVMEGYLSALIRDNADLEPGGIKQTKVQVVLPLDEIYVGLQADRDRPDVDRRVMQEELDEIKKRLEREEDPKEREKQYQIWAHQARTLQQALEISGPREELSNIVQRHRQVVILGDPGSGKTTLLRYLTLRFARAILAEPERLFQPQDLWDEKKVWRLPDLGPVRLPILLRISHYAEARQKEPDLALVDYLPRYFAGLQVPHADELGLLLRQLLDEGRCMVLLDGLDEIIDPTDRRNIAIAIGQFAGVFRETGLPEWLARSLTLAPTRIEEKPEAKTESDEEQKEIPIQWDKSVPEDVREEWEKQIKQRRKEWRRGARAMRLSWDLLDKARYAHVGNRFVVTSRIAGYHFAGVPGEFEHYTIRRMSMDDIKLFLEKWCPAVERRIAEAPDPAQVEQRARREIDGILQAVETTPGVRRMAENPLLLRILAIIHRNEAHLPQRRVELYETATVTLLRDWLLERGPKGAAIDDVKAMSLLGPVAFYIHENRASGFLSKGETERILGNILARERGEDTENPSLETREAVHQFLETVRQHSGLFVERGEGLYGFMHLTFQEYFTARQLVSSSAKARPQILERLHLPRWREPILLAVGSLSKQFYDDTHDLLRAILNVGSDYEPVLHRDLLFAAACVGDSVNVASVLRQEIAGRLLTIYCDRHHTGRYRLLQKQVKDALLTLCNDQGDIAVEAALAETLTGYANRVSLTCAMEAVDWLKARTPAVARALADCPDLGALPHARQLLREVQSRLLPNGNGVRPAPTGWDVYRDNSVLARLIGSMWRYGWQSAIETGLRVSSEVLREISTEAAGPGLRGVLQRLQDIARRLERETPDRSRTSNEVYEELRHLAYDLRQRAEEMGVPIWRDLGIELEMYRPDMPPQELGYRIRRVLDRAGYDLRRYPSPVSYAPVTDEILAGLDSLQRRLLDMADTPRAVELARTELERFTEQLTARAREEETSGLLETARELARLVADLGRADPASVDIRAVLLRARQLLEGGEVRDKLPEQLQRWGNLIVRNAQQGGTLAPLVAARATRLISLLPMPGDDALRASVLAIQDDLGIALLEVLHTTDDPQHYYGAALFLAYTGDGKPREGAVSIVLGDLEGTDAERRRRALQVLTERAFREHLQFTDAQRALLMGLLDASADLATPALDILLVLSELTPELLTRCWSVLRRPDHSLADAVREKLDEVKQVNGTRQLLALLDEGRRDPSLRPIVLELLRKVSWQESETFAQAMDWLTSEDVEVRHLVALLLASQDDPLAVPRAVLVSASQENLKATPLSPGLNWTALREDARLVRLLGGLWLRGWDDVLTQLWVAQPAKPYVDKHPRKYWKDFRTYPESEEVIRWLLEKTEFGQTFIPTFQHAAALLTQLEGGVAQGEPNAEHLTIIQQEISQKIDMLLVQPTAPPLLRAEAAIIVTVIRKEPVPPVTADILRSALASADNQGWFSALSRLALQKEQQPLVITALTEALQSPIRERRLLALTLLFNRKALRETMAGLMAARFLGQAMDADEALSGLGLLLQLEQSPAGVYPFLHSLCTPDSAHPLAIWLRQTLAVQNLTPGAPLAALARLLTSDDADARAATSLALLAADLPAVLLPVLAEAAQSPDDRVRMKGAQRLYGVCGKLPTDGSTSAVEWLLLFKREADARKDGHLGTLSITAVGTVMHNLPFWVSRWLEVAGQEQSPAQKLARQGLNTVMKVSPDVLSILCTTLNDPARSVSVRRAVVGTLIEILKNPDQRPNATIQVALTTALGSPDTQVRRNVAYALQWMVGQGAWQVAQALLHAAQSDPDAETRTLALRSLGRVLHEVRGFRDVDVSKEALFRWLLEKCPSWMDDFVKPIGELPSLRITPDAKAPLEILAQPDTLGLPEETVARLRDSDEWDELLQSARQEWQLRYYWVETLPHLPAAITEVETFLSSSDPANRRAAACALARLYHSDDDRPARLRDLLPDNTTLLRAMLDAATDVDSWGDEGTSDVSHHPWAVKQITGWMEAQPPEERARLIDTMLTDLEKAMEGMGRQDEDEDEDKFTDPNSGWSARRILVAVLSELSERLTYRAFTHTRDLADVVSLFARASTDPGSYSTRRFAIRALGNLQQLTDQVADVFFAACQDVGEVYRETRTAVSKFKAFGSGSLERLTAAIRNPNITVAYHAALLLGELGVSRSEELGRQGRKRVADELVRLLGEPLSERIVYDFTKDSDGERVGPLYDVIYEALLRVVAGPDAPTSAVAPE
jgi:hypothetical protein